MLDASPARGSTRERPPLPRAIADVDAAESWPTSSSCPTTCATRCGESSRRRSALRRPGGLIVAGMGGSAIGGALAARRARRPGVAADRPSPRLRAAVLGHARDRRPVRELLRRHRGDAGRLRGGRRPRRAAHRRDHGRRALGRARRARTACPSSRSPAALQPRAAVGYMTVAALEVAALLRRGAALHSEIDVAAAHLEGLAAEWGPDAPERLRWPRARARRCTGTVPVVLGAGPTAPVAYRWKTQLNENAKVPAFADELPEVDHNEIVGWAGGDGARRLRRRVPRRQRPASPRARAHRAHRDAHRPRTPPPTVVVEIAGREPHRAGALARRCSATSSRSTSRCCAAWTRRRSRLIEQLKAPPAPPAGLTRKP